MIETTQFYSVQRLISDKVAGPLVSDENTQYRRFGQIFALDYMGASEYEYGAFPDFLRDVHAHRDTLQSLELEIDGMTVFVAFSAHNNTPEHVEHQLRAIASGKLYTQGGARFEKPKPREGKKRRKGSATEPRESAEQFFRVDGWAEISLTTFWTVLPMNLERYKKMIACSVNYMDEQKKLDEETA